FGSSVSDPNGGTDAIEVQPLDLSGVADLHKPRTGFIVPGQLPPGNYTVSAWLRSTGSPVDIYLGIDDAHSTQFEIDGNWRRYARSFTLANTS
ncbi:hypothetical protein AAEH90_21230, partial [Shewanella algae]|uniref:hypothetical protein n=1 Tax=Shewanella algae TaxID=38313 RepID=UPI00313E337A